MKCKILPFPEQDRVKNCIKTAGQSFYADPETSLYYQELILIELINFYYSFQDDPYAAGIAQEIIRLRATIEEFHGEFIN